MTSKITLIKLGDISAKTHEARKAEGNIQRCAKKKTYPQGIPSDQNYLYERQRQNKITLKSITTEKYINKLPHRNYKEEFFSLNTKGFQEVVHININKEKHLCI